MNISYNWLSDLIKIDISPNELASSLTSVGLAVEGVHQTDDDYVFDIDLTSNRPDCLSHLGVAREVSALTGEKLFLKAKNEAELADIPIPAILAPDIVKIDAVEFCSRFTARIIRNVSVGASPDFLVRRLESIGERSINNIADVTNYVMHELGQPMHAFDLDKLVEKKAVVRLARDGEKLVTLDGVERILDPTMLVIADAEKPVAIAGIMGGADSAISDQTKNVLLEVAFFDRENIRNTSRKLGLASEASYRFERGVDIENLKDASDRAAEMIIDICGGDLREFIDLFPTKRKLRRIESQDLASAVMKLSGMEVDEVRCTQILESLGIVSDEPRQFCLPSWRHDLAIEEDLVEEVVRQVGYDQINVELPPSTGSGEYQESETRKRAMRQALCNLGFDETLTYSFIDAGFDTKFETLLTSNNGSDGDRFITLRDSIIEGANRMRPTLIPGLLESIRTNLNQQRKDLKLFEIGRCFISADQSGDLPNERELFAIAMTGTDALRKRLSSARSLDFFDAKGAIESALETIGFSSLEFRSAEVTHLQKGQTAEIFIDGGRVGTIGRLNEDLAAEFKFKQPVFVAEVDLDTVLNRNASEVQYKRLTRFPSVVRDVSFLVDRTTSFEDLRAAIIDVDSNLCRNIGFVDLFEGKGLDTGQRSLTIRLEYRSDDRTLIDDEVNAAHAEILAALKESLGIEQKA